MQVPKFSTLPYQRPDYEAAKAELDALTEQAKSAADYEALKDVIRRKNELMKRVNLQSELAFIRCYLDSSDAFYTAEMQYNAQTQAGLSDAEFSEALLYSPFAAQLDAEFGKEFLLTQRDNMRLNAAAHDLMAREQQLIGQYQQKKATMRIAFGGEELSEGQLEHYLDDPDRALRREAVAARDAAYAKDRTDFAQLLDELVHLRDGIAKANGFADYLAYATTCRRAAAATARRSCWRSAQRFAMRLCRCTPRPAVRRPNGWGWTGWPTTIPPAPGLTVGPSPSVTARHFCRPPSRCTAS